MSEFSIQLLPNGNSGPDDPWSIRLAAGDIVFTRLLREPGNQLDDYLLAPPAQLAFWICDNWWRLRWEGILAQGPAAPWRLAHDLAAIGGGYAWPRLSVWGDVDRIGFLSHSDPVGVVGPVRYLTDALTYVAATAFETEADGFLDRVADEHQGFGSDRGALRALVAALREERNDPDVALWRRLEARLGYDPDEGPNEAIEAANALADRFGLEAVEEALSAVPGAEASSVLASEVDTTQAWGKACDFSAILSNLPAVTRNPVEPPWVAAEKAARRVREIAGIAPGPLDSKHLAQVLGTTPRVLRGIPGTTRQTYGLRICADRTGERQVVSLRSRRAQDRRFELCRALGDTLWSRSDGIGPLTKTSTARQKFQRAFAQSLLCPFDDLHASLNTDCPEEEDIASAADRFQVSPRVVQTVLVNKGIMERERLNDRLEAA